MTKTKKTMRVGRAKRESAQPSKVRVDVLRARVLEIVESAEGMCRKLRAIRFAPLDWRDLPQVTKQDIDASVDPKAEALIMDAQVVFCDAGMGMQVLEEALAARAAVRRLRFRLSMLRSDEDEEDRDKAGAISKAILAEASLAFRKEVHL